MCCTEFSRDGSRCAVVVLAAEQVLCIAFDVQQQRWLPAQAQRRRDAAQSLFWADELRLSEPAGLLLVAALEPDSALMVFGVHTTAALRLPTERVCTCAWVPGAPSFVLLGSERLARLHLDPLSPGPARISWLDLAAALPADIQEHCSPELALAPEGSVFWVVQLSN